MLQFRANRDDLAGVLKQVLPCVERKTTIPILANVLIQAHDIWAIPRGFMMLICSTRIGLPETFDENAEVSNG